MSTAGIKAGRAFVEIGANDSKLQAALKRAQATLKAFGAGVTDAGLGLTAIGAAALGPLLSATKVFATAGDELAKMRDRTGLSVEALSDLGYAARQSGTDLATLETAVRVMARTIDDAASGSAGAVDALADLGLVAADLQKLSPEQQFRLMADRLSKIEDPSAKAAAAMQAFGKSGTQILPMLSAGTKGMEALEKANRDAGRTMSTETAEAAVVLGDTAADAFEQVKSLAVVIGAALAPALKEATERVTAIIQKVQTWASENKTLIVDILKAGAATAATGVALIAIGKIVGGVSSIVGLLAGTLKVLNSSMLLIAANPVAAALTVVAAGTAALVAVTMNAANAARDLAAAQAALTAKNDQARATDQLRIERLKQLSERNKLSASEMAEARDLIGTLNGRYGELGAVLDTTAGKIANVAGAMANFNAAIAKAAAADLKNELAAVELELAKIDARVVASRRNLEGFGAFDAVKGGQSLLDKRVAATQKLVDIQKRLNALAGGDVAAAFGVAPGDAEALRKRLGAGAADGGAEKIVELRQNQVDAEKKLADLQEAAARKRRSATENEIVEIARVRDEQLKLLDAIAAGENSRVGGARGDKLASIAEQRAKAEEDYRRDRLAAETKLYDDLEDAQAKAAEAAAAERIRIEKEIAREMEQIRIDAIADPVERERQRIESGRADAQAEASAAGVDPGKVDALFNARLAAVEAGASVASDELARSTSGTFSARGAEAMGGGAVAEIKKSNVTLAQMREILQRLYAANGTLGGLA